MQKDLLFEAFPLHLSACTAKASPAAGDHRVAVPQLCYLSSLWYLSH